MSRPTRTALRITLIYAAVVALWIYASDRVLWMLTSGASPDLMLRLSTYKGWFYAVATSVMVFWLVRRALGDMQQAQDRIQTSEDQLRDQQAALRELNQRLEQRVRERTADLEAARDELEAFSYSLSHDLRAPVRSMKGFTALLLRRHAADVPPDALDLLAQVSISADRMDRLIDDLMKFFRLSKDPMQPERVDMVEMARSVVAECADADRQTEVDIGVLPEAWGDAAMLRQVMRNLVGNAVKFTRDRTPARITVEGRVEDHEAIYCVRDNGVGFEPALASKLFTVFQRLHTQAEFEGNGVGLAIVARVIAKHRGRTWAEAKAGEGAAFWFALPRPA